ncbi:hypothetical protein U6A24_21205 [Aquimarina gracilis]|uniref:Natural product n=1 Tax=Aquimarina gracilis TaxID=874422 RepID=A0ABU6A1N9_9FLAO|nr:hypothetical protein [Aquimarina gracilis]MEB3348007.1 hypothetical protein [Aquimarina gracilis]
MKTKKKLILKKMTIGQLNQTTGGGNIDELFTITARETSPILCDYAYTKEPVCNPTVRLTFVEC